MDNKAAIEAALAINKTLSKLDRDTRLAVIEIVFSDQKRKQEVADHLGITVEQSDEWDRWMSDMGRW